MSGNIRRPHSRRRQSVTHAAELPIESQCPSQCGTFFTADVAPGEQASKAVFISPDTSFYRNTLHVEGAEGEAEAAGGQGEAADADAEDLYESGAEMYARGDHGAARTLFGRAAAQGHAGALTFLGAMNHEGVTRFGRR